MIFNSLTFLIFLLCVYCLYWVLDRRRQNLLLLVASYVFYGWWDWRFLSLLLFSSLVDYLVGLGLARTEHLLRRRILLYASLVTNLGLLGFFKYFNFFGESMSELLASLGMQASFTTLHIVLPVGISFYTFQTLSYTIDVYRRQCAPHKDLVEFLGFVSFFPQLVAGPIERARNLLGQFAAPREFDWAKAEDGIRQMLWGFFQKIVVADGLAGYVNAAYGQEGPINGGVMLLGSYFFAFQIYCDFSGYSNIAIGCARLFGFELMRNFAYPYFSRDIAEFWQRWHISLSTWFRDYLYIPLGGNRARLGRVAFNVLVTFTVSGLWHGANWTFILWGLLNGLYFLPGLIGRSLSGAPKKASETPKLGDLPRILLTFHLSLAAWIVFRSSSLTQLGDVLNSIIGSFDLMMFLRDGLKLKLFVVILVAVEWFQRGKAHPLEISQMPRPMRWAVCNAVILMILVVGSFEYSPFIYFQF